VPRTDQPAGANEARGHPAVRALGARGVGSPPVADPELAQALLAVLDAPGASIEGLVRLSGGASRETWAFDLVTVDGRRPLILQRMRPGRDSSSSGISMVMEADLLRAAGDAGVPVAGVVASDDGSVLGSAGMVVERLEGETIARKLLRDDEWAAAREHLGAQVGAAMAAVHRVPTDAVAGLGSTDQVAQYRELLDNLGEPHPAFELGLRHLDASRPSSNEPRLVHGDLRLGNLLVGPDGLRAILDWELAHLGDPMEDLGWFCVRAWRFGSPLPAGGVTTREALAGAYEDAGGAPVDLEALRWWELLGTLKWGVMCVMQAWSHLSGASRSMELATIGRRVCENEWDVLRLLPGAPLERRTPERSPPTASVHDRPTLAELLEAVREWVDDDVRAGTEGRLSFHARVATNALKILEREVALEPGLSQAHADRLARLGCTSEAELAARIRAGELDDRLDEVRTLVAGSVHDKLLVANPAWLD
jgi:aminoglycoside phosphotransferase (APT) family kinase protein